MLENPKMVGSNLIDCVPQHGPCPNNCNQCFYNEHFYAGHEPFVPSLEEAEGKIVRVNSGHDSNIQKPLVLEKTRHFPHKFYNTSIPDLDFRGAPVVLTVNRKEDSHWTAMEDIDNLMFVRFRANTWNMDMGEKVIRHYAEELRVPVVLTFMRYFDILRRNRSFDQWYEHKKHIQHRYWDISEEGWWMVMGELARNKLVFSCGTPQSPYCRDCGVCMTLYWRLMCTEGRIDEIMEEKTNGS